MAIALVTATGMEMRHALMGLPVSQSSAEALAAIPARGSARGPDRGMLQARLAGRDMLLVVTGVGPVNAALEMGLALGARKDISGVVNLGVAGSFDAQAAPLCDPVAATGEVWPEYGLADDDGWVDPRGIGFPQLGDPGETIAPGQADARIWDAIELDPARAAAAMGLHLSPAWARGVSLTVAGVTGTPGRAGLMRRRTRALTENMEGFPLALACRVSGLPFLELRTVSNLVGERDRSTWRMREALTGLGVVLATLAKAF